MKVDLIEYYGTDLTCVNAARVSFANESTWEYYDVDGRGPSESPSPCGEYFNIQKLSDKDSKLIHYLAKNKHTSCFEHQGATLRLKVPIFIARQIQRHRTFSYNEVSRRYVSTPPEFFWPDKWRKAAENVKQGSGDVITQLNIPGEILAVNPDILMRRAAEVALRAYDTAVSGGMAPELARMILPQNMYTEFYMTGNLRNWSHFLKLRLDGHAQKEVQDVAKMVQDILTPLWPVSMEALNNYE